VTATGTQGKKSNKKYVFAAEKEYDRDRWIECLQRNAKYLINQQLLLQQQQQQEQLNNENGENNETSNDNNNNNNNNPLHLSQNNNNNNDEDGIELEETESSIRLERGFSTTSNSSIIVTENHCKAGYLLKKSPSILKGWQKRYFITEKNGDIAYYKNEQEAKQGGENDIRGVIRLKDIMPQPLGVQYNEKTLELTLTLETKKVQLKANDAEEVVAWAENILQCMELQRK
jgi:hypothetical protein